jgi:erythromycin esterase-like protein
MMGKLCRLALAAALATLVDPPADRGQVQAGGTAALIREAAQPVTGQEGDHAQIIAAAAASSRVLLGESTHGSHEYYRERARLTERLVRNHGFRAVAIEGDWSATWRVNQYVRGLGSDRSADEALRGFTKFPRWMWRNAEFRDFVERLRAFNLSRPPADRVGVYGMDVYDMHEAADAAVAYAETVDRAAAARLRSHYRCFDGYRDAEAYGVAMRRGRSCEPQARAAVQEMARLPRPADPIAAERHFAAQRSAASVAAAEAYFRTAAVGTHSWNVRDEQMARNVDAIAAHVEAVSGTSGKVVVWAHNSHVGDARATSAAQRGELNLGQLMRQRHGERALLVGFFTHGGSVFAAPEWGERGRRYDVRPALAGSTAALFHETRLPSFSLLLRGRPALVQALSVPLLQRAIGVIYARDTERQSHYLRAVPGRQFDAMIYFERTGPVDALAR